MKRTIRLLPAFALLAAAAGCSVTETVNDLSKVDYKSSVPVKKASLEVPPDMVSPRRDDRFSLPARTAEGTTYSAYAKDRVVSEGRAAAPVAVLPEVSGARIERDANQRWLVVERSPEEVWQVVRTFWVDNGFVLRTESPETGLIETDWAENRPAVPDSWVRSQLQRVLGSLYSLGTRDRFRTRLEVNGKTTELYVSHRGMVEEFVGAQKERSVWVTRPNDPELEAEFLRRLQLRFAAPQPGDTVAGAKTVVAAVSPAASATSKAIVVSAEGASALRLQDGFDRSWRQVGLALDRIGFTVEDRDRSKGVFFVRYVDPDQPAKESNFISRMLSSGDNRDLTGRRYRVNLVAEGQGTRLGVLDEKGMQPASEPDRRIANQIVSLLQEQLK